MNNYSIYDPSFLNSTLYQDFMKEYPGEGTLRVRAYTANEALPVEGIKVEITTYYQSNIIVFYQGETNSSGLIDRIVLPAPVNTNDLEVPNRLLYQVHVVYEKDNLDKEYSVGMYDGVCSVQNISIEPATLKVGVLEWQ